MKWLLIAIGGALGALARNGVYERLADAEGSFPLATLLVNVTGAFALGAVVEAGMRRPGMEMVVLGVGWASWAPSRRT